MAALAVIHNDIDQLVDQVFGLFPVREGFPQFIEFMVGGV